MTITNDREQVRQNTGRLGDHYMIEPIGKTQNRFEKIYKSLSEQVFRQLVFRYGEQ